APAPSHSLSSSTNDAAVFDRHLLLLRRRIGHVSGQRSIAHRNLRASTDAFRFFCRATFAFCVRPHFLGPLPRHVTGTSEDFFALAGLIKTLRGRRALRRLLGSMIFASPFL